MSESSNKKQFLDKVGLAALWDKICATIGIAVDKYIPETVNITYGELVELRNSHELKPGEKYRITDYVTTVKSNQLDVISGNHRFDIVVEALDNCTLSEHAKAIRHEDDWYFETENLEAWQLWYCLDNDKRRFEWADDGVVDYKAEFIGAYTVDSSGNKGEYHIDKEPYIYEWDWLPHPDTGDDCIVLYTQDPMYYEYEGADYEDIYFYDGVVTVDGQEYDSWKKWTVGADNWVSLHEYTNPDTGEIEYFEHYYLLTERIVFGDEVIWPELPNTSNGKGVIYRMIDEYGNDCPYDFKNIKYYRDGMGIYVYTFTWIDEGYNVMDTSIFGNNGVLTYSGEIYGVHDNVIKPYYATDEYTGSFIHKQNLNTIIFISDYSFEYMGNEGFYGYYNNSFGYDCYHNVFGNNCNYNCLESNCGNNLFGNNCYSNSLGNGCSDNIFSNDCSDNSFGNICYSNSFGSECYSNSFGNNCNHNKFGNDCYSNSFGNICYSNSFGDDCYTNSFGNGCYSNSFGDDCYTNSFGNGCYGNSFENSCHYNSFGNSCHYNSFGFASSSNSFGNSCRYNSFGNSFFYNSFGNSCHYNSFRLSTSTSGTLLKHCSCNHFNDGCKYNVIWNDTQPTSDNKLQNINIVRGVSGTSSAYNFINIVDKNTDYEIKVAKNSNGEIKVYCEADLIA